MENAPPDPFQVSRRERLNRVRVGATGLAVIVLIVLLAASFSGAASDEPELTPEAIAETREAIAAGEPVEEEAPQEPLAELGVAPGTGPVEEAAGDVTAEADSSGN